MPSSSTDPGIVCYQCNSPLPVSVFNTMEEARCPSCSSHIRVFAYQALWKGAEAGKSAETILDDAEAGCFYHGQKKAVVTCSHCGRFLCALCDVELEGAHYCPPCIESAGKKRRMETLENRRILYDDIALSLVILPMLFFYFTVLTAPVALYISIRYWNAPGSIIPRSKLRFVVAICLSILQIAGWILVIYFLLRVAAR
jgi:hypothetical protein